MSYDIKNLQLDLAAARAGKTWLLLPEPYRDQAMGQEYPLPNRIEELQLLASIPFPRNKRDSGVLYLKRAFVEWRSRIESKTRSHLEIDRTEHVARHAADNFKTKLRKMRGEAAASLQEVQRHADEAIASLDELLTLGRSGLEFQMKAHLEGQEWQGEKITAAAFRQCFFMVSRTVKGLGLPSGQRQRAEEAVIQEVAACLRSGAEPTVDADSPGSGEQKTQVSH